MTVLIKKSSTFWCLVIPQYVPPLCSISIQLSSFLQSYPSWVTLSHHLAVNKWIALGTKLVEILYDSQMKQLAGSRVFCTVLSARFIPVFRSALYQNMYGILCEKKIISCPLHNQASFSNYHRAISHILLAKSTARKGLQSINSAGFSFAAV